MLQPRRKKIRELAWLILAGFCLHQVACDIGSDGIGTGRVRAERVGRDENDVNTVLLLDNPGRNGRYLATAVPVVTSTARTFVQEGTTTEYATHVIGTRLDKGKLYASVVGTSSRVYYDTHLARYSIDNQILPTSPRSAIKPTAHLVYPAKDTKVPYSSFSSGLVYQTAVKGDSTKSLKTSPELVPVGKHPQGVENDDSHDGVVRFSSQSSSSKHVERKQKEADEQDNYLESPNSDLFKKRNVDESQNTPHVNPAQVVRPVLGLPTFTIKHDFAPSGFSADVEEEETTEGKKIKDLLSLRGGKALYRNGVKTDSRKLDTVTYKGFADFTTTVGDTVIIFMPNTAAMEPSTAVTPSSSVKSPPAEEPNQIVTKMKTFYSITPGMQTKTVTGHSLSMQTSLPTHLILPDVGTRQMKAFPPAGPVHVVTGNKKSASVISDLKSEPKLSSDSDLKPSLVLAEPSVLEPSVQDVFAEPPALIGSTTSFLPIATEPLATFATTRTQILAAADQKQPLGLVKVLGGTRAYNSTTTLFTSLIYGTLIDGTYTQVIHSTSSIFYAAQSTTLVDQPKSTTEGTTENTTENAPSTTDADMSTNAVESSTPSTDESSDDQVKTGRKIKTRPIDQIIADNSGSTSSDKRQELSPSGIKLKTSSTDSYLTRIVPTTAFKTFTYLTTFFIPDGDKTTTSVRSREVTSSEVSLITKVINANVVQASKIISSASSSLPEKLTTTAKSTTTEQSDQISTTEGSTNSLEDVKTTTELSAEKEKSTDYVPEVMETTTDSADQLTDVTTEGLVKSEQVITTESEEITVTSPTPTTPAVENEDEEEIDLIFKTLYTTYTYLTTFFQESTTSVSSREVVVTNIVTSTLDNNFFLQSSAVAELFEGSESLLKTEVMPTSVGIGRPTTQHFPSVDAIDDSYGDEASNHQSGPASPDIQPSSVAEGATKTFFTTYTYFTTIFVDGETTISSRTEVYTNVVTPSIVPSPASEDGIRNTPVALGEYLNEDDALAGEVEGSSADDYVDLSHVRTPVLKSTPHYAYSSTISRNRLSSGVGSSPNVQSSLPTRERNDNDITVKSTPKFDDRYATISRPQNDGASAAAFEGTTRKSQITVRDAEDENEDPSTVTHDPTTAQDSIDVRASYDQDSSESSTKLPTAADSDVPQIQVRLDTFVAGEDIEPSTVINEPMVVKTMAMVTDITSSSSGGNDILDDQISSESNTEEIEPSPILLLQTSFTTFTYFTTVYKGSTSSEVISRLETVTNVVTETLSPTSSSIIEEDSTLPITYFTTFTYWTTLYRDGNTVVTSREETVSNIITPTVTLPAVLITETPDIETNSQIEPTKSEPTTYYTTYTYFTTSYIGNSTVLNSRLETITNIVNETDDQIGRAIGTSVPDQLIVDQITKTEPATLPTGLLSTIATSQVEDGTTTLFSTDVYGTYIDGLYAKILESSTQIVTEGVSPSIQVQPTGVVSLNEGRIVDAHGISTTYFTTKAIGTYIEQLYAEVLESTSSIKVDEEKKTLLASELDDEKQLKTGLVRLIEGSIVKDDTTTFYESKVVGTVIDGRYAQIIESTSSFKIGMAKTKLPQGVIVATSAITLDQAITGTSSHGTSPSSTVLESSLGDGGGEDGDSEEEFDEDDDDDDDDGDGTAKKSKKSRLTFSTRKRTFTPVIRPFASRNRPTFNPRRKTANASSATTITRTTLTPTITATPAAKSTEGRGRFASNRRQSSALNEVGPRPSSSTSRRFSRVRGSTPAIGVSSTLSPTVGRGRSTTRVFPTATASAPGTSRRAGFFRSSSARGGSSDFPLKSTSGGASSSRLRIRPTSSGFGRAASSVYTTPSTAEQPDPEDNVLTTFVTEETPNNTEEEQDSPTQPISTTTESPRRSNPLLRFRRPPTLRTQSTTARPSTTTSPRKNPLLRRTSDANNNRVTTTSTTTAKPAASFNSRFKNLNNNRPRPSNSLFPRRGLLKKPEDEVKEVSREVEKEEDDLAKDEGEEEIADNDYEGSEVKEVEETKTEATLRKSKALSPQIRPFVGFQRRRSKRQTSEYGARRDATSRTANYNQRFRRPVTTRTQSQVQDRNDYIDDEPVTEAPRSKTTSRFTPRSRPSQPTQQKIRSTTASSNAGRSQFTLREKDTTPRTNFRRPTPAPRRRPPITKETSIRQTPNSPRIRPQSNSQTDATQYSRLSGRRGYSSSNTNSRRPQSRSRTRGDTPNFDSYTYSQSSFDGTITVTHRVPTEVTIPIVNGKVTEYRNVITASPSTEVLGPHQYTKTSGKDGNPVLQLTSEVTGTLAGGVTEITQYILHETATTSVTFTPTVIRGRKTSFSHIVPSTVYDVERLVSTIQPHLSPNAPLANILLSQLLLGNLNLAQPNINPLLGLNTAMGPATPVTEYKTHATTYVTTVTKGSSTILPLTFRGKEILTTIVDTTLETITATEFITDTIVTTPTAVAAPNQQQLNSLLLPALLQAQLLQSQNQQSTQSPLISLQQLQDAKAEEALDIESVARGSSKRRKQEDPDRQVRDSETEFDDDEDVIILEEEPAVPRYKSSRKKPSRMQVADKKPPDPPNPPSTSVITLYVSGRRPGEFSTVLSTVVVDDDNSATIKKREAEFAAPDLFIVDSSKSPDLERYFPNDFEDTLLFSSNDIAIESSRTETQSLESIVGDVSKYNIADQFSPTIKSKPSTERDVIEKSSTTIDQATGHFLSKGPAELAPLKRKVVKESNRGEEKTTNQHENPTNNDATMNSSNNYEHLIRTRRDVDDSGFEKDIATSRPISGRRRVRVRVPIARRVPDDASYKDLSLSEAQRPDQVAIAKDLRRGEQEFGVRKVKILRTGNNEHFADDDRDHHKKRIVIRRRKPAENLLDDRKLSIDHEQYLEPQEKLPDAYERELAFHTPSSQSIMPSHRRQITITKKRPIFATSSVAPTSTQRRRVVVTKKRLLSTEDITPTHSMKTLYSYMYSVMNETNEEEPHSMVKVSQVYMIGNIPEDNQFENNRSSLSKSKESISLEKTTETPDVLLSKEISSPSQLSPIESSFSDVTSLADSVVATQLLGGNISFASTYIETAMNEAVKEEHVGNNDTEKDNKMQEEVSSATDGSSSTEENTSFDGPRFIRPTRFSITRKPSRTKPSFPGGRRKTSEQLSSSSPSSSETTTTATRNSYRSSSLKYNPNRSSTRQAEVKPTPSLNSFKQSSKSYRPNKNKTYGKPSHSTAIPVEPKIEQTGDSDLGELAFTDAPKTEQIMNLEESDVSITPTTPVEDKEPHSYLTRLVTRTRLRTYTYIVTRVSGNEEVVTSSTEVKPHITTTTLTQVVPVPDVQGTARDDRVLNLAEARYNLATKVMSNGVEVIVAGDRSTLPGEPEILRVLAPSHTRPTTLPASTLTDHMMMFLPQQPSEINEFVTKTYLTTYTYGEEDLVVTNTVTEERTATPSKLTEVVTLSASPVLETGVFHTTYTYFNTLVDEDLPLVVSSTEVIDNTVTAPIDRLTQKSVKETNTYLSSMDFSKTVTEGGKPQVLSTNNVLTQKVVTNIEAQTVTPLPSTGSTTDVVKTYFVTYTYLNTYLEDGSTVVSSDVSISTDIVTEKFYINPKRTSVPLKSSTEAEKQKPTKPVKLFATKTYLTTFTYFTTLLQEGADQKTSTLVSSHTSVLQNIVTETLSHDIFGSEQQNVNMKITSTENLAPTKTLMQDVEMTVTQGLASSMEDDNDNSNTNSIVTGSTIVFFDEQDQIDTQSVQSATPALDVANNGPQTTILNGQMGENQGAVSAQALASQSIQQDVPRPQGVNAFETSILAASTVTSSGNTLLAGDEVIMLTQANGNVSMIPVSDPTNKRPNGGSFGPGGNEIQVSDLLSLGSLGINGLNALGPVINAMAGLIQSNLHDHNRRNDSATSSKPGLTYIDGNGKPRPIFLSHGDRTTPRSPIYIPVGGLAEDVDTAESVNQESWSDSHGRHPSAENGNSVVLGRPTHESPLLSDGIAISPGQVITANSDVIVGKPGLLGPRPPKIHSEKEIPAGMRPPPPPQPRPKRPANDQYFGPPPALDQVGHQSVNTHVGSPQSPPKREHAPSHGPTRNHVGGASGHQQIREQPIRNYNGGSPNRDHQQNQSPIRNQFPSHVPSRNHDIESDLNPPPITNNLASFHIEKDTPLYTPPIGADIIVHPPILNENHYIITNNPQSQEFGQFPVSSGVQAVYGGQPQPNDIILGKMPTGSHVLDSSAGQPLLVNIQPSQVANVIIKDGSSSANPFGENEEYVNHSPSHGSKNRPNFGGDDIIVSDNQHHYAVPVGSVHQTRMDPPAAELALAGHDLQSGNIDISPLGINVDISPGQGINVDVSSNHGLNGPATGHVHGNEHISPSGIVLDEPLNNRPLLNEISFGKPGPSNSRPDSSQDLPRRPQRPLQSNGLSRPRFPPANYRPGSSNKHHGTNNNQLLQDKNHGSHQISQGNNQGSGDPNIHNYPQSPTEFMVPPPPPPTQFSSTPNVIPLKSILSQESTADSNQDHSFPDDNEGDYDSLELDGGEVVQASNSRPMTVGQGPHNLTTRKPISKPTLITEMPEVFMRPPQLPVSNINVHQVFDKRPSRPGNNAASFDVVVQPQGNFGRPQIFDEKPFDEKSAAPNFDERKEVSNQGTQGGRVPVFTPPGRPHFEESSKKPYVNVKRPTPSFEKPALTASFDQESQGNTPRPFVNRPASPNQSDIDRESVLGLSPPPEPQHIPVVKIGGQRRPPVSNYRNLTRPGSPYKFEVPPPSNGNKQSPRLPLQEILTLSETNFQQNQKQDSGTQNPDRPDKKPGHVDFGKIKPVAIQPPPKYKPNSITPNLSGDRNRGTQLTSPTLKTSIVKPRPVITEASSPLQTVVIVGKPIQSNPPTVPFSLQQPGQIIGSETAYLDHVLQPTPTVNYVRNTVASSKPVFTTSKTPHGNHFTRPSNVLKPTRVSGSVGFDNQFAVGKESSFKTKQHVEIPTRYITHTKTLTVTLTETTVISSEGHRPSTRTVVVTKTQTTTQVDTVTQIHTLVKPTEIRATSTVTTTVSASASQYPPGSPFDPANYPQFPVKIAPLEKPNKEADNTGKDSEKADGKKDGKKGPSVLPEENDTFFVVVNDKKLSSVSVSTSNKDKPAVSFDVKEEEVASRDETDSNEVNRAVLLGGVLVAAPPPRHGPPSSARPTTACRPDCSPARNELCQRVNGNMRCVCRPGFARMFPDRPCKPTYTYTLQLDLDRHGKEPLKFDPVLRDSTSAKFRSLAEASREGLDRLVMQSDLRDIYHGVAVHGFQPSPKKDGVQVSFYVQLSDNADETRLKDVFKKSLRTSNFSLGGTDMYADKELLQYLLAEDFDECASTRFHDCSEHSHCFNLRGTYTCSCKEGFADLSENRLFPGRVCSAELIGCDKCHYHGTCYSRGDDQLMCECFQWYSGENCQVNLKVLLIALVTIGALLLALLLVCAVLTCMKRNRSRKPGNNAPGFLRYRGSARTLDKRAMIADSSSEGSIDNGPVTFLAPTHQPSSFLGNKSVLKGARRISEPHPSGTIISMGYADQRDRSLTVMIPRAKYRPVPPTSPHLTMSTFGVEENKKAIVQEQKLLGYLEHGIQETRNVNNPRRKQSNGTNHSSDSSTPKKISTARKASNGALVSAGFEVSAMVGCKESSENELLTPQNTMNPHFPPIRTNERTVSEVRSCNETTIQPPTKSFHGPSQYGSKPSSRNRDEAHTMAERDLGSTLLMPQTHLYRPDRGSDISNFDSL